ncbi:MAG TPA: decarboxylating 6-phosphogluconate dehydrogenase [Candidatus Acidoferrales bacterium]|nr:decarboxylating 6-phosphogluconate dehydrogenase [Candidatus Acidoferrales bacterium]
MEIGLIGLGKMGANMAERLLKSGHKVVGYDRDAQAVKRIVDQGNIGANSIDDLISKLKLPRTVWVMVPAGKPVDDTIDIMIAGLNRDDIVIDGGNSYYRDSIRRAKKLADHGVKMIDAGVSGGIWGLKEGYSIMVGGEKGTVDYLKPIFEALAPAKDKGWGHVGPNGAGHFVKMVHNGIEYGLMQAYAEGFNLMKRKTEFDLDLHQVAEIWRYGSVVRSWLLDLTAAALQDDQNLTKVAPYVADSGEGRWTALEAIELGVSLPIIAQSLYERFASQDSEEYGNRLLAMMRHEFGGHAIKGEEK